MAGLEIAATTIASNVVTATLRSSPSNGSAERGPFRFHIPCDPQIVVKALPEVGIEDHSDRVLTDIPSRPSLLLWVCQFYLASLLAILFNSARGSHQFTG